jgi:hypothetical protein|tara:strand:- start:915 stop:1301 length:387 start_codon:yes stop_codon:yes gene_type:complete
MEIMNNSISYSQEEKVCWYDKFKGLQGSILTKARRFNKLGLIKHLTGYAWIVNPLPGNSMTYNVSRDCGIMKCQCQRNRTKNLICSHILAVELWKNINNSSNGNIGDTPYQYTLNTHREIETNGGNNQ